MVQIHYRIYSKLLYIYFFYVGIIFAKTWAANGWLLASKVVAV